MQPTIELNLCPWCGSRAIYQSSFSPNRFVYNTQQKVYCSSRFKSFCDARTKSYTSRSLYSPYSSKEPDYEDIKQKVIDEWNEGKVVIPLTFQLPYNHLITERIPLVGSMVDAAKMTIVIPDHGKLFQEIKRRLRIILEPKLQKHMFKIIGYNESYNNCTLLSYESKYHSTFVFECEQTFYQNSKNNSDTAWLKKTSTRPPIYDKIFDILGESE